ncbi:hypothetical protein AB0F13_09620 [Streptomyces sp. NPDC026206]|uniref:hypothetical protein n=1 Tax=Streptomyces sp. NPDC026206 TaxID=3157089 RepID=UPI0033F9DB0F
MLKHAIAPAGFFTQVPNEILRHPRLSAAAVRLLTWQLSLPDGSGQPLSETAERAGIKKTAFIRAKRELLAEGYVHEWRRQGEGGRWTTRQLVSNVPLTPEEARAVRDGGQPTAQEPTVGEPAPRAVGRPQEKTEENTPHPPHPLAERGAQALTEVTRGERKLRLAPRDIRALAPLTAEWLVRGATLADLRAALTSDLPPAVRSPAGLTRDRLVRKMPDPAPGPVPRPQPLRACTGGCGRMIRPVADETACRDCRVDAATGTYSCDDVSGAIAATKRGMATIRELLHAGTATT